MIKRVNQKESDDALFEKRIKAALFRIDCPDADLLLDFKWALLSEKKTAVLQHHLTSCPHCNNELAQLASPPKITTPSADPKKLFPKRFIFAQFVGHHAVTRSSGNESNRGRILLSRFYKVEALGWGIDLRWGLESNGLFFLEGLLLGPKSEIFDTITIDIIEDIDVETGLIKLLTKTTPDHAGVFLLESIPVGRYALRLRTPAGTIPVPDIILNMPNE